MVLGAGRGPLIDRSLVAADAAGKSIKLFALEKSDVAFVTLQNKKKHEWGNSVTLVHADMRDWSPPAKADLIVSELLGSFGDNELSPECLHEAETRILKDNGTIIPQKYSAWIAPVSSDRLWSECQATTTPQSGFVVHMREAWSPWQAKRLWSFEHGRFQASKDTEPGMHRFERQGSARFEGAGQHIFVHGLGAYFEATLYKDVTLSINPATHTPAMCSWFAMFFPLLRPVLMTPEQTLEVQFWRITQQRKVWYEWAASTEAKDSGALVATQPIVNSRGKDYWIGL